MKRERGSRKSREQVYARRPLRRSRETGYPKLRLFYIIGTICAVLAIVHAGYRALLDAPYFQLKEIRISGVSPSLKSELRQLVQEIVGPDANTLSLDIRRLRERIREHPRLKSVTAEISYPSTILIAAVERTPAAIVSADGFYLVSQDGVVIERLRPADLRTYDLPYLTGVPPEKIEIGKRIASAGVSRALDMLELLKKRNPDLYSRFSEVNVSQDPISRTDNVTARLRGGMEVRFGEANPVEKLPLLDFFIQLQQRAGADPFNMAYVDLRVPNQIVYLDRLTAQALRSGAIDPAWGSLGGDNSGQAEKGSRSSGSDERALPKQDQKESDSGTPASTQRAKAGKKNTVTENNGAGSESMEQHSSGEPLIAPPSIEEEIGRGPRWRLKNPLRIFRQRNRESSDDPVILAPAESSD